MRRLALALCAVLALAAAPRSAAAAPPQLSGVRRHVDLVLPAAPAIHVSSGGHVVWLDVEAPAGAVARALVPLDGAFEVRLLPLGRTRTRIAVRHRHARLRVAAGTGPDAARIRIGPESHAAVLHRAARRAVRNLPVAADPGPRTDLWREAEALLARGDVEAARRRYERLLDERALRDLAHVRLAHVFVATGHIREARARLAGLARKLPRTVGAALARVWDHYLAAITGEADPDPDRVEVAVLALDRSPHRPFVAWIAALVLGEIGAPQRGLLLLPPAGAVPRAQRADLEADRRALLVAALAKATFERHTVDAAALAAVHARDFDAHPDGLHLASWGVEALVGAGDGARAEHLARATLARAPAAADEARLVALLGWAEALEGHLDKLAASVDFLARFHPDAPDLPDLVEVLAGANLRTAGYAPTVALLRRLAERAADPGIARHALAVAADLADAEGKARDVADLLERMRALGFDDEARRNRQLARSWVDLERYADAEGLLRRVVASTTDPERRDALGYALAVAEFALGRPEDGDAILDALVRHGTRWGTIAHLLQRERELQRLLAMPATPTEEVP